MGHPQVTGYGRIEEKDGRYFFIASIDTGEENNPTGSAEIKYSITLRDYASFNAMLNTSKSKSPRLKVRGKLEISAEE